MATVRMKRERLEARVTPAQKALLQRAANLSGRSVTDFVVSSAQAAAEETVRLHEVVALSARDSAKFVRALLDPASPNGRLRVAAERYRAATKS